MPCVLSLAENRRCHELVAVLPAHKVCSFEENGSAIVPGKGLPVLLRGEGAIDSSGNGGLIRFVVRAEVVGMVGGEGLLRELAGLNLGRADRMRSGKPG